MSLERQHVLRKGSWSWILRVAELTAWGAAAVLFLVLHSTRLPSSVYRLGLVLVASLAAAIMAAFRFVIPRVRRTEVLAVCGLAAALVSATAVFGLLRGHVPSIQLTFVPVIVIAGLLGGLWAGLVTAACAVIIYVGISIAAGQPPTVVAGALNASIFALSGAVAGLLVEELRSHYRAEQEEHRLALAVRHRLLAVLDSVGEAIVFRDRHDVVRIVNQRAEELFDLGSESFIGLPVVELLRKIARETEDPEGFMERFQELRDRPDLELRANVEQLLPQRRRLSLYSRPTIDDGDVLVGRIDVYSDVTESVRRAEEIELLYEEARKTAETYQRGLLPTEVPAMARVNLVAHYVAAAGRRAVCGDFYDFIELAGGGQGIVLGDVCGIGPTAANDAALVRYTLRSLAWEERDVPRLLQRLNRHVANHLPPERFVRLLVGFIDPDGAMLSYANAGHVPPVVYRAKSGTVEWLSSGGLVLGVDATERYDVATAPLEPGDMLVFYTDGVTEASRAGRPLGQGKLADLVAEYGVGTPGELVQAIRRAVEAWAGSDELRDDLALLVCQRVPDTVIEEPTRELVLPNDVSRIADVRAFVAGFLADVRATVEASQEMLLAVGEAAANACRHGQKPSGRSEVRVRCVLEGADVIVSVSDEGPGFDVDAVERNGLPDRFASGGRGLFLMRQFVDSFEVSSSPQGTTVTLRRRVADPEVAARLGAASDEAG
jgi:serine phosphatase RsbU (regulator of sigma subunit)/anti-sigma regulatory factor (Ser/Thr protein kinase)